MPNIALQVAPVIRHGRTYCRLGAFTSCSRQVRTHQEPNHSRAGVTSKCVIRNDTTSLPASPINVEVIDAGDGNLLEVHHASITLSGML